MMKIKILLLFVMLFVGSSMYAQEPPRSPLQVDSLHLNRGFELPDSLLFLADWRPDFRLMEPVRVKKNLTHKSVIVVQQRHLPKSVTVLNNNTFRLGHAFNASNGQAWNWSPFLDSYLDARTLSFPMR